MLIEYFRKNQPKLLPKMVIFHMSYAELMWLVCHSEGPVYRLSILRQPLRNQRRGKRDVWSPPVTSPTTAPASPASTPGGVSPDPPRQHSIAHGGATVPGSSENPVSPSRATHGVFGSGMPSVCHEVDTGGSSAAVDHEATRAPGVHDAARGVEAPAIL
jgi:hypothetical protein